MADAIYRDRVLRARAEDPCEKLVDGFRLFEYALGITKMGVQAELNTMDEEAVMKGVQKRFDMVRKVREKGLYQPWKPAA
ncbi:hypothetical protein [Prosthecobacter fusiformis]|uniref:hypothetical protein n=1 Tax=Prosthecobacter fusiformis TaxID=48464 RepID=UPI001AAE1EF5|nr:hypothetical protein [Prosthecobacter fusiformis]